ncbi:NAD(P)-dependent alcohol dehydrogenase [Modestobacter versicolor]|uniref:Aryl-alcohol dehydrogenase n=1 Tax=Modestobacter versicolor TaxID=429133 RepID=A0A323V710_9ACTN|nr:NAD(P)-dependent alcohol dehydrogenase [Modestobacter versicolor]MBB3674956.1 aryl-alcohol dehydrogenase [Modestobacter versicolor]PZA20444.1 NAD(P)-dependent alcohol dehydrogenase [Modestobacter versicolor]
MRITAAVVEEQHTPFVVRDVELDDPGPGEVLVRVAAAGFCHTDGLARDGELPFPLPGVLGHEGAGTVVAVGDGVTSVREGQAVVMGWPWCGECRNCLDGEPRYCLQLGALCFSGQRPIGNSGLRTTGGDPVAGAFFGQSSFATHSLATATSLVPVPDGLPVDLMGPLACGLATGAGAVFHTARPLPGSSIVVYGAGTVGLAAVMAARNSPASTIIAVDRHASRLQLARELGATEVIDATDTDPVQAVADICGGPADFAVECTGIIAVVRQAIDSVGMRGQAILIGGAPAGAEFSADHMTTLWGKSIVGTLGGSGRSQRLIGGLMDLYAAGRFPIDRLVERFPLERIGEAMEASYSGAVVKPVITMPQG